MNTLIKNIIYKFKLSKINYLNHKFKKYIIKFEEIGDKIKIYNSSNDYKLVDNNIVNKVKLLEIIKEHKEEIDKKVDYYNNFKDDYQIIIIVNASILITLGVLFGISFFFGSSILLMISFVSFVISLYLFSLYTYKILLFREEVKRLVYIRENKDILDRNELGELCLDTFIILKDKFYNIVLKIMNVIDDIKVKFN